MPFEPIPRPAGAPRAEAVGRDAAVDSARMPTAAPIAPASAAERRELVLVGAGHAHLQVLRSFAMKPPPGGARLTLVVDTPLAVYSGMVPGLVAGRYRPEELEIDALPLARRAGARVIFAAATGVDPRGRRIAIAGRPPLPYDLASIDIGSSVAGLDLPGVREHALATRPIGRFAERVAAVEEAMLRAERAYRLVVVGGGAAGVELAATFQARWSSLRPGRERSLEVTLVHEGERLLPGDPGPLARRVEGALSGRGIVLRGGRRVVAAEAAGIHLDDGSSLPCDALIWATGARAHDFFSAGDGALRLDGRGFVLTRSTLQVVGHDDLFAAGDCATLADHPATPKAGVYAVRQGPVLARNLRAALAGRRLAAYRPQRDFLTLLNLGDGSAIGAKWGRSFEGRWAMALKDRIDRRFVERFRLLEPDGRPARGEHGLAAMTASPAGGGEGGAPGVCGGCAAKLGRASLLGVLARVGDLGAPPPAPEVVLGWKEGDDVAAYRVPGGDLVVASVDAFRAFGDDPFLVGEVAARNALSDLQAKGVEPRWAQALVTLPLAEGARTAEETLFQLLAGARSVFDPLGVRLLGGHTSRGLELQAGFSVQGVAEGGGGALLRRGGPLAPGMALVLTRPLGTGVLFHADMMGRARGPWLAGALAAIRQGHGRAPSLAREARAVAATDVTGFGLAGHLAGMLDPSACSARLVLGAIPPLAGALELLALGERSSFHEENARLRRAFALGPGLSWSEDPARAASSGESRARLELLFDPQTAGGLLLAVPERGAGGLLERLRAEGFELAARIGEIVEPREDGAIALLVAE